MSENPARAVTEDSFEEFFKDLVRSYSPDAKFVYHKDLKCSGCQACCKGVPVSIFLSDIFRISKHLNMTPRDFFVKYGGFMPAADDKGNTAYFFVLNATNGCPFLTANGCSIHDMKPMICRAYPVTEPVHIQYDIIQKRNKVHPVCAIHQAAPNTYIIPDIGILIDIHIGAVVMYEYIVEVGNQNWSPRIADGFVHRELAARRRKDERENVVCKMATTIVDCMKKLNKNS